MYDRLAPQSQLRLNTEQHRVDLLLGLRNQLAQGEQLARTVPFEPFYQGTGETGTVFEGPRDYSVRIGSSKSPEAETGKQAPYGGKESSTQHGFSLRIR